MTASAPHVPVLLDEVIAALAPAPGAVIVDATFGAGGYTRRLLDTRTTNDALSYTKVATLVVTGGEVPANASAGIATARMSTARRRCRDSLARTATSDA